MSPRRVHWRAWLWLVAILVAARLALAMILAPLAAERLSRVLGTRVDVDDVGFAPIDAIFTLRNVVVHAADEGMVAEDAKPAITAERVQIDVQWLPLLHRSVVVRLLTLESARIDLDRLRRAGWTPERFQNLDPASELPLGWSFALERIALRDTRVHPSDAASADVAPLEVTVRDAQVSTRPQRVSAFGRAPNLRVDAVVDGGRLLIVGSSDLREDGVAIDAQADLKDAPLERFAAWAPADLAGSSVAGKLSGRLHYQRDPGRRERLTGRLRGQHVAVHVPTLAEPALQIRRVEAEVDGIDLLQHRVALGAVMLYGSRLAVRPDLVAPLPLLDAVARAPAEPIEPRRAARPTPRVASWIWTIGHLVAPSGRLLVTGPGERMSLATNVWGESLGPGAYWSPLRAWIGWDGGAAMFDGTARMTRGFSIDGRLTASDIDAVAVARKLGPPLATLVQAGRGAIDLNVELALGDARVASHDLRGKIDADVSPLGVSGRISFADLWLAADDPNVFAFGARGLDLDLARVVPVKDGSGSQLADVRLAGAALDSPYLKLTHTADGWSTETASSDPESPPPPVTLEVANLRARNGRLLVSDQAASPPIAVELAALDGSAHALRLPAADLGDFAIQATDRRLGALRLVGARAGDELTADLAAPFVSLPAVAPYLQRARLPYAFTGGTGAVRSRLAIARDHWSADTTLTLLEPTLGGDDASLERSLGMTPAAAFAALQERHGEISLRLPLISPGSADAGELDATVAEAVREAMARPRLSPPLQIQFVAGLAEPGPQTPRQLATIAEVLATRPDVVVELRAAISKADRRWFAEQQVAAEPWEEPTGFKGFLRAVGVRDQRTRIQDALEARGAGRPGRLDAADEAALGALVAEVPPISDDRLVQLATARSTLLANMLADRQGVVAMRVVVAQPTAQESATPPIVDARFLPGPEGPLW